MVFVYRDANWGAKSGPSTYKDSGYKEDKPKTSAAAERPSHVAPVNLARIDRSALRRATNRTTGIAPQSNREPQRESQRESKTVEIELELAGAHGVTVVAVTTDLELRSALTDMLPKNSLVFADSPDQVLDRSAPSNCAVLIVEHALSRTAFEQLKSHLKAVAPALVNIMVGTHDDGSSLIGLLSGGWIDRFMVKPFEPGPTRIALRSALQQHHSLRSRVQVDQARQDTGDSESASSAAPDIQVMASRSTHEPMRSDKPKISAIARPLKFDLADDSESDLKNANDSVANVNVIAPPQETTRHAEPPRQSSQPSSVSSTNLALAAVITIAALAILVAWGIFTRAPESNVNQAMVNKVVAGHLAAAQRAFELGSYVDPPELSAIHFYKAALELDPMSEPAKRGLAAVVERLIADSKQLIETGDLLRAQSTLDNVRRLQPHHRELADVTASLLNARATERRTIQAANTVSPTIEPIVVTASHGSAVAKKAPGNSSANIERKVTNAPQRQDQPLQPESRAIHKLEPSSASKLPIAIPAVAAIELSRAAPDGPVQSAQSSRNLQTNQQLSDSNVKQTDEVKTVEPAQDTAELRAAVKVAAVREAITTDSAISSTTGSGPINVATSAANSKPVLLKYVSPVYPYKARTTGIQGWLDVNFMVTSDGNVVNPRIEGGTLDSRFHRAALAAVAQWKFSPASNAAAPNRAMNGRLEFKLTD